jgi:ketosteroid isomerase-like protein
MFLLFRGSAGVVNHGTRGKRGFMKLVTFKSVRFVLLVIAINVAVHAQSAESTRQANLENLAAAERAFAAETVKLGFRDGFIKYFADDGIGFGPHPQRTREELMKMQAPTGPRRVMFNWAPMFGDVSDAGDLGYTTGPVLYTDLIDPSKPPRRAIYFSVWQKQTDGTWKVVVDLGVDTPNAVAPIDTRFTAANAVGPRRSNPMKGTPEDDYRGLDWAMWSSLAKTRPAAGGVTNLDTQFRVHRKGMMPVTDLTALATLKTSATKYEIIDGKIASSGDLAYTYGKYSIDFDQNVTETGYYVHVWRRNADSKWRLVVDVQNPLPKADK